MKLLYDVFLQKQAQMTRMSERRLLETCGVLQKTSWNQITLKALILCI